MEAILKRESIKDIYSISRVPFYNWISKNIPQFKNKSVVELDVMTHELWESISRNFIQSNITLTSPLKSNLLKIKQRLELYNINYSVENSYHLSFLDESKDIIISNNSNFVQNKNSINEVIRVLTDKGLFLNLVTGDNHIRSLRNLYNRGRRVREKVNPKQLINYKSKELLKNFSSVSLRDYKRVLHIKNPNDILGYYLANRNEKVRAWAMEESNWILREADKIIRSRGHFCVEVHLAMFVCKSKG